MGISIPGLSNHDSWVGNGDAAASRAPYGTSNRPEPHGDACLVNYPLAIKHGCLLLPKGWRYTVTDRQTMGEAGKRQKRKVLTAQTMWQWWWWWWGYVETHIPVQKSILAPLQGLEDMKDRQNTCLKQRGCQGWTWQQWVVGNTHVGCDTAWSVCAQGANCRPRASAAKQSDRSALAVPSTIYEPGQDGILLPLCIRSAKEGVVGKCT